MDSQLKDRILKAVAAEMSYDVVWDRIVEVVAMYEARTTDELKTTLQDCKDEFDYRPCRRDLGDEVDRLRIVLAARSVS